MLEERRASLEMALLKIEGALECLDELFEADAVPTVEEALAALTSEDGRETGTPQEES